MAGVGESPLAPQERASLIAFADPGGNLVAFLELFYSSCSFVEPLEPRNRTSNHPNHPAFLRNLVEPWWNSRGTLPQGRLGPPRSLSGLRPQSFQLLGKNRNRTFNPSESVLHAQGVEALQDKLEDCGEVLGRRRLLPRRRGPVFLCKPGRARNSFLCAPNPTGGMPHANETEGGSRTLGFAR